MRQEVKASVFGEIKNRKKIETTDLKMLWKAALVRLPKQNRRLESKILCPYISGTAYWCEQWIRYFGFWRKARWYLKRWKSALQFWLSFRKTSGPKSAKGEKRAFTQISADVAKPSPEEIPPEPTWPAQQDGYGRWKPDGTILKTDKLSLRGVWFFSWTPDKGYTALRRPERWKSIPRIPNASPPTVTASSTSSPGRPTDFPTTFGYIRLPSTCCRSSR